jgi:hypothetical protein
MVTAPHGIATRSGSSESAAAAAVVKARAKLR